jgi:leucyl-tRNA synthetase
MKLPGIFCLEGEWDSNLRRRESVMPMLDLLERLGIAQSIHRDVATKDEFFYYLEKWGQKAYHDYVILYLASHGDSGCLALGKESVMLEELEDALVGKADGGVIYFGSCLTMVTDDDRLKKFVKRTGASVVVGYRAEIGWLEAAAFELLLLERLLRGERSDAFFRRLTKDHGKFASDLGLVAATAKAVMPA